jgi:hypothetical protein
MVDGNHDPEEVVRPPTQADLVRLCRDLNARGSRYIVLGGMAMIEMGLDRGTMDVDFLVDASAENVSRVCQSLCLLPDGAAKDVRDSDVQEYGVVRIHDEISVDLMGKACGIDYGEASSMIEWREVDGVRIPFASIELLWRTKQTYREKDALDRAFLKRLIEEREKGR